MPVRIRPTTPRIAGLPQSNRLIEYLTTLTGGRRTDTRAHTFIYAETEPYPDAEGETETETDTHSLACLG